jgi:hypothetical protein
VHVADGRFLHEEETEVSDAQSIPKLEGRSTLWILKVSIRRSARYLILKKLFFIIIPVKTSDKFVLKNRKH